MSACFACSGSSPALLFPGGGGGGAVSACLCLLKSQLSPPSSQVIAAESNEGHLLVPGIALTQYAGLTVKETQSPSLEPYSHLCTPRR